MTDFQHKEEISLLDLQSDLKGYSWNIFRQDVMAGLTVALLTLPQAIAYALLAGLPLSCGLFAAIYSSIIAALFGSSRQLIVGPSNAIAILIQSGTAGIIYTYYRDLGGADRDLVAVEILTQLTFIVAVVQIIAAWCRLGTLTQFVSHSVVVGYMTGTALAVVVNQLYTLLGIPTMPEVGSLYENAVYLFSHLHHLQWMTAFLGLASVAMLYILKHIHTKIPAAVITFVVASCVIELFGFSSYSGSSLVADLFHHNDLHLPNILVLGDTGEVYDVAPEFTIPFINMRVMDGVIPVAFAIALLSVMESTAVAKSIAAHTGQHLSTNQEIFGIGLGNLVSSITGAMPVSGSPSRSGLNYHSGGQTRFAAIFNAIFVAFFVVVFGFLVTRIPLTTLSALVLVTAIGIVNTKHLLFCLRSTPSDAFVLWSTLLSCLFFSLDMAFYIGVALSIILYLKKAALPRLAEYDIDDCGKLKDMDPASTHEHRDIRIIKVEGELFFGAADLFQTSLKATAEDDSSTKVIVLQLKNARDVDATTCFALQQFHDYLNSRGKYLIACGMTAPVWEVFKSSGIVDVIGEEHLFSFDAQNPDNHMQKALQKAKELAAQPPKQISHVVDDFGEELLEEASEI